MGKLLGFVSLLITAASAAFAQGTFPDKPLRMVYPYPAGGTGDTIMRIVADRLGTELKQPVIVENRPGATGVTGSKYVADSAPNGYTLGLTSNGTHAAVVSLFRNPGYDPLKHFIHIGLCATLPYMLVVKSGFPASNVSELVAWARANPGKLAMPHYSSSTRLPVHLLRTAGNFQVLEVPYKGAAQILPDIVSGQIQAAFLPLEIAGAWEKSGNVKSIGVASAVRLNSAPGAPPIAQEFPGVEMTTWLGLAVPAGTPKDITAKLRISLNNALGTQEFRDRMRAIGADAATATPEEIEQRIKLEIATWTKFVKEAGIQPE